MGATGLQGCRLRVKPLAVVALSALSVVMAELDHVSQTHADSHTEHVFLVLGGYFLLASIAVSIAFCVSSRLTMARLALTLSLSARSSSALSPCPPTTCQETTCQQIRTVSSWARSAPPRRTSPVRSTVSTRIVPQAHGFLII